MRILLDSLQGVLLTGGSEAFYEDVKEKDKIVKVPTLYLRTTQYIISYS